MSGVMSMNGLVTVEAAAPIKAGGATATDNSRVIKAVTPPNFANDHRSFEVGNVTINVFPTAYMLNHNVARQLIKELQNSGLIVLPADSTHGAETGRPDGEIYKLVNEHFANNKPHKSLSVTHMDELDTGDTLEGSTVSPEKFSDKLTGWLANVIGSGENSIGTRFHAIDPSNLNAYRNFEKTKGGARVIVGGVGAGVPPHIAYIGEEAIEGQTQPDLNFFARRITLREEEAQRRGVKTAATMGMSFFDSPNLESVIISAKGVAKAPSVAYAFRDALLGDAPQGVSAFGELIRKFADPKQAGELILNFDQDTFNGVAHNKKLMDKLTTVNTGR